MSEPTDVFGVAYATVKDTRVGDVLKTDDGFTCMEPGSLKVVKGHDLNEGDGEGLYIECDEGHHGLAGQYEPHEDGDYYVGLYPINTDTDVVAIDDAVLDLGKKYQACIAEVAASLEEMIEIYRDEVKYGVGVPYDEQPECIRRAMDALRDWKAAEKKVSDYAWDEKL